MLRFWKLYIEVWNKPWLIHFCYLYFSTVQNILFHYGLDAKVNFVLPKSGNHLNDPAHPYLILEPFKLSWLDSQENKLPWHSQLKQKQAYDIFNLHTQWNASAVR